METVVTGSMWAGLAVVVLIMRSSDPIVVGRGKPHRLSLPAAGHGSVPRESASFHLTAMLRRYLASSTGRQVTNVIATSRRIFISKTI